MPVLRFRVRTRSSKDNRFRPAEGMNGRDPDERLFSNCCRLTRHSSLTGHHRSAVKEAAADGKESVEDSETARSENSVALA